MSRAKFCSLCGERLTTTRRSLLPPRASCARCTKPHRLPLVVFLMLLTTLFTGFLLGRLTTPRREFKFIGTPASLAGPGGAPFSTSPATATAGATTQESDDWALCGAPTKAGRPCRRKVRGGGYCWQHRDKLPASGSK